MTEQTNNPPGDAGVPTPARADGSISIRRALDRLMVAAQAARLAIDIASDAEQTTREARLSPADISRNWRAVNLVAQSTFDRLYAEVLEIDTLLRSL
jgi:hypothetical protein